MLRKWEEGGRWKDRRWWVVDKNLEGRDGSKGKEGTREKQGTEEISQGV